MADSAIGVSEVTLTPSDSASQAPKSAGSTKPSTTGGPRKGPAKPAVDKGAPQGAVQVQAGGQKKTGNKSATVSATIPLSGWGEIDLHPFRRDIQPVFTVDAKPFDDLVDVVYTSIQSRYSTGGKHIPLGLFRYYCFTMWWLRVLWLHKANANILSSEEKAALNILQAGEEFQVPSPIAQYLGNLGNFVQGGENFYFKKMPIELDDGLNKGGIVKEGWFETTSGSIKTDSESWWWYSQLPSPGVYTTYASNEANESFGNPASRLGFDFIAPALEGAIAYPTDNIVGWSNTISPAHHSSWRATYGMLGWSTTSLPSDMQTSFNISTSTLKWVSERLATLKDYKLFSSKQLVLSVQGSSILANYLRTEDAKSQKTQFPAPDQVASNKVNASRFSDLAVASRFAIDAKSISATFSFGYRIERCKQFSKYDKNFKPSWHNASNYQPWLFVKEDLSAYITPTAGWFDTMNAPFVLGSQPFLNVDRFATHQLSRSVGLDAALVLSETRT